VGLENERKIHKKSILEPKPDQGPQKAWKSILFPERFTILLGLEPAKELQKHGICPVFLTPRLSRTTKIIFCDASKNKFELFIEGDCDSGRLE